MSKFRESKEIVAPPFERNSSQSSLNEETDTEHMHKLRVGVLNAKTPLPGAEFKIWPLKSAPEVTYFGNKFLICLGFASPN